MNSKKNINQKKGFTLIEILVVIGLLSVLFAISIIAINPARNFQESRNAQRSSDVLQILNAVTQYTSRDGNVLGDLGTIPTCPTTAAIGSGTGNVNLGTALVDEYIVAIPEDPSTGTAADTGYTICQSANGRVTIAAPDAENSASISVRR